MSLHEIYFKGLNLAVLLPQKIDTISFIPTSNELYAIYSFFSQHREFSQKETFDMLEKIIQNGEIKSPYKKIATINDNFQTQLFIFYKKGRFGSSHRAFERRYVELQVLLDLYPEGFFQESLFSKTQKDFFKKEPLPHLFKHNLGLGQQLLPLYGSLLYEENFLNYKELLVKIHELQKLSLQKKDFPCDFGSLEFFLDLYTNSLKSAINFQ